MSTYYVTTAIDYTNAPPHIGHAYEKVLADVIARWHRLKGEPVYFLIGVDQHGQKVQQTAQKLGKHPAEHAAEMTAHFKALWQKMGISNDGWAETTSELHKRCVQQILTNLKEKGQLYKKAYIGFYSVRQEQFLTDKERDEHGNFGPEWGEVVELEEENWYFRLSDHAEWMRDFITSSPTFVFPEFRKAEILNALERSFDSDLCISRPKERLHWGIEIPFDPDFVTYVWFDALINYISYAGYLAPEGSNLPDFAQLWPADAQVIGKDIMVPAHAIYWPAMLHAMGFDADQMPRLLVHGWWNIQGEKMSKTLGNVVDPNTLIDTFGLDAVRYYLVRDIATGKDSNFDADRLVMLYNTELANDFGNLCNRSLNMTKRYCDSTLSAPDYDDDLNVTLRNALTESTQAYISAMDEHRVNDALGALNTFVTQCNGYIEQSKPWELAKNPDQAPRLASVLRHLLESCTHVAYLLSPVLLNAPTQIQEQLNATALLIGKTPNSLTWGILPPTHTVNEPSPAFPRILSEEEKEKLRAKQAKQS